MSNNPWLQRLGEATDYRQLQSVFSQLQAEAAITTNGRELVVTIDEAIVRIERERARDDDELQEFKQQYAAFREEQRGVLGWFRRHLPFTQTRREQRQHSDGIADQEAEIAADNLVIARAQMLKQRLLPPEERKLGQSAQRWRSELSRSESINRIEAYAVTIERLSGEVEISEAFIDEIRADIEAFAKASFASPEDRARQLQDLQDARNEVAEFETELKEERDMRAAAIKRAGEMVTDELRSSDHEFYQVTEQIRHLQSHRRHATSTAEKAEEIENLLGKGRKLADASAACASKREQLRCRQEQLQRDLTIAQDQLGQLTSELAEVTEPYERARRYSERAEAALVAAKRVDDRHHQAADGTEQNAMDVDDGVDLEYQRLRQEQTEARQQLQIASAPYDLIKSKYDHAESACQGLMDELKQSAKSLEKNQKDAHDLSDQLRHLKLQVATAMSDFQPQLNEFLLSSDAAGMQSHVQQLNRTWQWSDVLDDQYRTPNDLTDDSNDKLERRVSQLVEAIERDRRELKQRLTEAKSIRDQRLSLRCRELMGEQVARWIADQ